MRNLISKYKDNIHSYIDSLNSELLIEAANLIYSTLADGNTIFIAGNGGSMATSMHLAEDLMLNNNFRGRAIALSNPAAITAISNDTEYKNVFVSQLKNLMKKGDLFIGISASGESKNIIDAIKYANSIGKTIGIVGFGGGAVRSKSNVKLYVCTETKDYEGTEDLHLVICHILAKLIKQW